MMKLKRTLCYLACGWLILLFLTSFGIARIKPLYSYYNPFYGARSISLSNAFIAVADDLTAVFRNPAGIAEFNVPKLFVNYRSDNLSYNYAQQTSISDSIASTYTNDFSSTFKNWDFLSLSVPVDFWDIHWNFAVSYYRYFPYGFQAQLTESFIDGSDATNNYKNILTISGSAGIDVLGFTSAFYLSDYFSFGITLQQFLNSGEISYQYTTASTSYTQTFTESIKDNNLVLGLLGKLTKNIIVGLSLHTQFTTNFNSKYTVQIDGGEATSTESQGTKLVVPVQLGLGLVLKPYPFMRLSFDYSKFYWVKSKLTNYYSSPSDLAFPVRDDYNFTQKNIENYRMGLQLKIPFNWAVVFLRGGMFNDHQLFVSGETSPRRVKFNGFSMGIGVNISSWVELDLAYMKQRSQWNEISYFDSSSTVNTRYNNDIFSLSLFLSFGKKEEF